jgi:hypothetical protein
MHGLLRGRRERSTPVKNQAGKVDVRFWRNGVMGANKKGIAVAICARKAGFYSAVTDSIAA